MALGKDPNGEPVQGFAPKKIVTITADAAWTPEASDTAFRVPSSITYYVDALSGHVGTLLAGSVTVLNPFVTSYTFDTTMELEVM